MTFIEVHANDSDPVLERIVTDAFASTYHNYLETALIVHFGRAIRWQGRLFRELCLPADPMALQHENMIFHAATMPKDRARLMIGSIRGAVFTTPPEPGDKLAARFIECGRCQSETTIKPFEYTDHYRQA